MDDGTRFHGPISYLAARISQLFFSGRPPLGGWGDGGGTGSPPAVPSSNGLITGAAETSALAQALSAQTVGGSAGRGLRGVSMGSVIIITLLHSGPAVAQNRDQLNQGRQR